MNLYPWTPLFLSIVFFCMSCEGKRNAEQTSADAQISEPSLKISERDTSSDESEKSVDELIKESPASAIEPKEFSEVSSKKKIQGTTKELTQTTSEKSNAVTLQPENGNGKPKEVIKPASIPDTAMMDKNKVISFVNRPDHEIFSRFLKKYVSDEGWVNYSGMTNDKTLLTSYIKSLEGPFEMKTWSTEEKLAFWLNVYNAYTINLIIENYPVKSIRDLYGGKPWSQPVIYANATYYSLDDIQKKIIMKQFGDPRIHFAINCAAKSCPPLLNRAFTKDNLESLLESRTKSFINGSPNRILKRQAVLSPIFQWYEEDFGDMYEFINKYSSVPVNDKTKITFSEYDWTLNGR